METYQTDVIFMIHVIEFIFLNIRKLLPWPSISTKMCEPINCLLPIIHIVNKSCRKIFTFFSFLIRLRENCHIK